MYWPLTVLSMALLWLLHRLYTLFKVPPSELVKALKIEIPKASKLSINNITDSAIYLHWDLPTLNDEIVNFILFINDKETSLLNGTDSHCYLTGLNPGTKYKIDLISINSKGFKAKSQSIYVRTKSKDLQTHSNRILLENADTLYSLLTGKSESTSNVKKFLGATLNAGEPRTTRSRSNTLNSLNAKDLDAENGNIMPSNASTHTTTALPDPRSIEDIEELRYYLESGQEELHAVLNQQTTALREFKELEMNLLQERDALRERKRLEDTNRQTTKNESKLLDDSRRRTELKKIKQESALSNKRKAIEKMQSDLSSWNLKLEEFEKSRAEMENSEVTVHRELEADITKKKEFVRRLQSELSKLEEEFRVANQKKKQLEQTRPSYTKVFRKLLSATHNSTGTVSSEGLRALDTLKDLNPELHNKIQREVNEDTRLEAEWRAQQQREVNHCAKASQTFDGLKAENKSLKTGVWSPKNAESLSPSGTSSVPLNHSVSYMNNNNLQFQPPTTSSSVQNFSYFSGSSPSINSIPQNLSNQSQVQTSSSFNPTGSLWNTFQSDNSSKNLVLSTNGADIFRNDNGIDSPSVNHFLPADLIGDDLADFDYQAPPQPQGTLQAHTPKSSHFDFPSENMNSSFLSNPQAGFNNDFALSPQFNIDTPASPPQSFLNNEFLSAHNSPSGNINNELNSILSGGAEMIINTNASNPIPPSQAIDGSKDTHFNPFSPRRLSNVFSFGRSKSSEEQQATSTPVNPVKQQSKFFSSNGDIAQGNTSTQDKKDTLFPFQRNGSQNGNSKFFSNFETVWQDPNTLNVHNRNVSVNSTNSMEKDNDSWFRFHISQPEIPASVDSSDNMMGPVILTETNKSSNGTSVKSVKSYADTNASSPSFFKKKFPFVGSNEKSPTKNNSLHRTISPAGEPIDEQESEDQQQTQQIPKRLFSRSRKSSSSNIRKQSMSSTDYELENGSIQSNSTNGRSIVKKLNIFGKNTNKELNEDVIDENVEAENDLNDEK